MLQSRTTDPGAGPAAGAARPAAGRARDRPLGYALAVVSVAVAAVIVLTPQVSKGAVAVPFFAVLITAWYGGLKPGLFATGLEAVTALAVGLYGRDDFPLWWWFQFGQFI